MSRVFYTMGLDQVNQEYARKMVNSFKKFHPEEKILLLTLKDMKEMGATQYDLNHRMMAFTTNVLMKEYDTVVNVDADQIITGDLSHTFEGEFDVAMPYNANPTEILYMGNDPVAVWDIEPMKYLNTAYRVFKSKKMVKHLVKLCYSSFFEKYNYRDQDMINIIANYFPYNVKRLDEGNRWHGLISKRFWQYIEKRGDKLVLPKNNTWPTDEDKIIKIIHWGGGEGVKKLDVDIRFTKEVASYLKQLML